jgi:hypothetical protein
MPSTYTLISSNVLGSSAASVTFSAIPSTYTDLVLRISARSDRAASSNNFTINLNSATTNYSYTYLNQNGSTASSSRDTIAGGNTYLFGGALGAANLTANTFNSIEIYIPSYLASQNRPLSIVNAMENNATSPYEQSAIAGRYSSTTAISSVTLKSGDGSFNFVSGSSFFLYGIKNS